MLKFGIYLLEDLCEHLEKLTKLLFITRLCQVCEHLLYKGGILQSTAVWIHYQLSFLCW